MQLCNIYLNQTPHTIIYVDKSTLKFIRVFVKSKIQREYRELGNT